MSAAPSFGSFRGRPRAEWLADGRSMRLLATFRYVDPAGVLWTAPRGSVVDGASIPRPLWTLVGSPFTGHYRRASIVHDVYCSSAARCWERVHRMFYLAMRCGGVGEALAKLMFAAVFHFGPRWATPGVRSLTPTAQPRLMVEADVERLAGAVGRGAGLRELERLAA